MTTHGGGPSPGLRALARAHGVFNLVGGLWPLVSIRSFEAVFGPKHDRWLVYTVGGLLVTVGLVQLSTPGDGAALRQARRLGLGTAATLLAIDAVYVPAGRLRWTYLLDAAAEAGWLVAWAAIDQREKSGDPVPLRAVAAMTDMRSATGPGR